MLNFSWKDFTEGIKSSLQLSSEKSSTKYLNIQGDYTFYMEVSAKGEIPYQTSVLSVNAYTRKDKQIAIATRCQWYRINGERVYSMSGVASNTYQLTALDVGCTIKVELIPLEDNQKGTACAFIGPIKIDPSTKTTLEGILFSGGTKFPIYIYLNHLQLNSTIVLQNENIRILTEDKGKEKILKFQLCLNSPQIELSYIDPLELVFFGGDTKEHQEWEEKVKEFTGGQTKLIAKFFSKVQRDLFILSLKCFNTKQNLVFGQILNETFFGQKTISDNNNKNGTSISDLLLDIDTLKRELYTMVDRNNLLLKEKDSYKKHVKRLEDELHSTINNYNAILNQTKSNNNISYNSNSNQIKNLQDEINRVLQKLDQMENEKKQLQNQLESFQKKNEKKQKINEFGQDNILLRIQQENEHLQGEIKIIKENDQKLIQMKEKIHQQNMQGFIETIDNLNSVNDKLRKELKMCKNQLDEINSKQKQKVNSYPQQSEIDSYNIIHKYQELLTENHELKNQLKTKSHQYDELKLKNIELERDIEKLTLNMYMGNNNMNSENSVLRQSMEETEALQHQMNQMQKKVESLQKELEKKMKELEKFKTEKNQIFENLTKLNQKLLSENIQLQQQIKSHQDDVLLGDLDSSSTQSINNSIYMGYSVPLRDKICALEIELAKKNKMLETSNLEKDKLLVEISKIYAERRIIIK